MHQFTFLHGVLFWALLLASSVVFGCRYEVGPFSVDTLIIDGDTVYIERDQIMLPEDSLPGASNKELKRINRQLWTATVGLGLNVSNGDIQSYEGSLIPLDNFIGLNYAPQPNLAFHADFGACFLSVKTPRGSIDLSAIAGITRNKVKVKYTTLQDPLELNLDSIIGYGNDNHELFVEYFTRTETPEIGEVDSLYPQLKKTILEYGTTDASLKLRATFSRGPKSMRYFVESGIVKRFVTLKPTEDAFYLFNENGGMSLASPSSFSSINILVPHFAAGAEMRIRRSSGSDGSFQTVGAALSGSFPAASLNRGEQLAMQFSNFGISAYFRCFF